MNTLLLSEISYLDFNFTITDVFYENWLRRKSFSLYKNKKRPCSAFFFICSDIEVSFYLDDGTPLITAKNGDVIFIPKDMTYYVSVFKKNSKKSNTYTINLHFFDDKQNEFVLSENISLLTNLKDSRQEALLENICNEFHREKVNLVKLKSIFYNMLELIEASYSKEKDFSYPIRKGAKTFCEEWNKNKKIEEYAQMDGVSVTYFYRCFRKWAGCSPIEYRNRLRLSNAESLLKCTNMKIQEISAIIGFDDPFYFCNIFSKAYGLSPKKYREKHQL